VGAGAARELAAVGLALVDDRGDLVVVVAEDVVQKESARSTGLSRSSSMRKAIDIESASSACAAGSSSSLSSGSGSHSPT
jgi:hypothetical protein